MRIENVEVFKDGRGMYAVSCETKDARYHIWIKDPDGLMEGVLYKNPRDGGFAFNTRRLKLDSKASSEIAQEMMDQAKRLDLFTKADRDVLEKEEQERKDREESIRLEKAREAGPKMLEVLRDLHICLGTGEMMASPWWRGKRERIEKVIGDLL